MSEQNNKQWVFASHPVGMVKEEHFRLEEAPATTPLEDGEILLKIAYITVDPYMRGRMHDRKSYFPGFEVGKPFSGGVVSEVIESKNDDYSVGDHLTGFGPWILYRKYNAKTSEASAIGGANSLIKLPKGIVPSYFLGVLGMPGLTAFLSIRHIGKPEAGNTVFVSGAAGVVGGAAGQIFKSLGCKVIGAAGTDEKCANLKNIGFDHTINYKTDNLDEKLTEYAPDGIDVYFDNVGGKILDTTLLHMNTFGRIIACGCISVYNDKADMSESYGLKNYFAIVGKQLTYQGFIVSRWAAEFAAATKELSALLQEGKLTVRETVNEGFESVPKAFIGLFTGANEGKMIVKV
eukprot:TRINITY_DN10750_c0_g1_i1.p1 TRINITY_DN10750_c0_g1~~TRINITY_DN10750_c0_g1_i1.p1  ORF type:complete len:365 (-),score=103.26 TRINITY_DN10750_c0_g1_i1:18-1061(-)